MLVSVGAMLSPIPSAHGQEFREPIAQNGIPISTLETAFAEIRKILEPQFEELLRTPATHIVAKRETLRCMEQWDEEDAPIAMYLREFAIDIPLARVKAGGSPLHWAGGPRFRLSNGWWVI
ncbi:MAG: hypothetical protein IID36_09420, partial [Planctomycetes bacterium]|nr:hypothetical protein [Planctomycetota bacterium]